MAAPGLTSALSVPGAFRAALPSFRPPATTKPGQESVATLGPPRVTIPRSSSGFGWATSLVLAALAAAGAFFLLYVVRFFRGTWHP
jgi:hypothetical protein